MEVKNVPLADYVDMYEKDKKKLLKEQPDVFDNCKYNDKIAYFPDGYRKTNRYGKSTCLKTCARTGTNQKDIGYSLYIVFHYTTNGYKAISTVKNRSYLSCSGSKAWLNGVEIKAISIQWTKDGCAYVHQNDLPICLFDEYGPVPLEKTLL